MNTAIQQRISSLSNDQRGQGMTEYIIIVALVAIALIVIVTVFGDSIRNQFNRSAGEIDGLGEAPVHQVEDPTALG